LKKNISLLIVIILFLSCSFSASAHPSGVTCYPGAEILGYSVDCNNHQANNSFTYSYHGLLGSYTQYVTSGVSKWSGTVSISYKTSPLLSQGAVSVYTDPDTSTVAEFYNYSSNSSGHLTSWEIRFNKSIMDGRTTTKNETTAAHEFGHAIGLNDLKHSTNQSQLMYGYSDRTATAPSTKDIIGAKEATK